MKNFSSPAGQKKDSGACVTPPVRISESGRRPAGKTAILSVAKKAGVSTATVSRVFSRHPYVAEKTREKVLAAAQELGYAPGIASSQRIMGIMTTMNSFFPDAYMVQVFRHITGEFFQRGFTTQIFGPEYLPWLHKKSFRGVVLHNPEYAVHLRHLGIPFLLMNNVAEGMPCVATDHKKGMIRAVDYLFERGHRRIAFLRSFYHGWGSEEREKGYRAALTGRAIDFDPALLGFFKTKEDIPGILAELLKRGPTALIAEGESLAAMVNYGLYLLKIRVPEDLSVITFEDSEYSRYMTPPQTTVDQDFPSLSRAVADALCELTMPGKKEDVGIRFIDSNRIIERSTVAAPRAGK